MEHFGGVEFIDENSSGPGVRLRKRKQRKVMSRHRVYHTKPAWAGLGLFWQNEPKYLRYPKVLIIRKLPTGGQCVEANARERFVSTPHSP